MFTVLGFQFGLQCLFGGGVQLGAFLFQLPPGRIQLPRSIRFCLVQFFHAREMFTVLGFQFGLQCLLGGRTHLGVFLFQFPPGRLQLPRSIRLRLIQLFHAREMFAVLRFQFCVQLGTFLFQLSRGRIQLPPGRLQLPRSIRLRLVQLFHAREMFVVLGFQFGLQCLLGGGVQLGAFLFQLPPGRLQVPRSIRFCLVQLFHAREMFTVQGFQFTFKSQSFFCLQLCRVHVKFFHATRALHPAPFFHLIQFFHATRVLRPPLFFHLIQFFQPVLAFGIKVLLGRFQLCGFVLFKFFHAGQKMQHVLLFALNTRFFFVRKRVFQSRSCGFQFRSFGGNGFGTPRIQAAFHCDEFNEVGLALV